MQSLGKRESTASLSNCQQPSVAGTVLRKMEVHEARVQDHHRHQAEGLQGCWGAPGVGHKQGRGRSALDRKHPRSLGRGGGVLEGEMGGREARQEFQKR